MQKTDPDPGGKAPKSLQINLSGALIAHNTGFDNDLRLRAPTMKQVANRLKDQAKVKAGALILLIDQVEARFARHTNAAIRVVRFLRRAALRQKSFFVLVKPDRR